MRISLSINPPAIIVTRRPGHPNKWGKAMGPIVILPSDAPEHLRAHELLHVWQWLCASVMAMAVVWPYVYLNPEYASVLGLPFFLNAALKFTSKAYVFRIEAAAYALSVKYEPLSLDRFARALAGSTYSLGKSYDECRAAIQSRVGEGSWF